MGKALKDLEEEWAEAAEEAAAEEAAAEEAAAEEEAAVEEAEEEALTPLVIGEDEVAAEEDAALDEALEESILAASVSNAVQAFSSAFSGVLTAASGAAQWGWASGAQEVDANSAAAGGATVDTSLPSGLSGGSPQWGWAFDSQEVDLDAADGDGANANAADANIGNYTGVATGGEPDSTLKTLYKSFGPPQYLADNADMSVDGAPSAPFSIPVQNLPPPPVDADSVEMKGNPDLQDGSYLHFQTTIGDGVTYDVYENDLLLYSHNQGQTFAYLVPTSTPAPPAATPQPLDDQTPPPGRQLPYTPPPSQGLGNSSIFANSPSSGIFANSPSGGIFANSAPNSTSARTGGGSPTAVLSSLTASTGGGSPTLPPAGSFLQSNLVQGLGGFVAGTGIARVPGGFLLAPVGQATGLLGKPTGTFAFFQGAGEIATGIAQLAAGVAEEIGGGALDAIGAAAAPETLGGSLAVTAVGVSLNVASWGLIARGVGNIGLGIVTSGHALFTVGDESLGPELQQSTGGGGGSNSLGPELRQSTGGGGGPGRVLDAEQWLEELANRIEPASEAETEALRQAYDETIGIGLTEGEAGSLAHEFLGAKGRGEGIDFGVSLTGELELEGDLYELKTHWGGPFEELTFLGAARQLAAAEGQLINAGYSPSAIQLFQYHLFFDPATRQAVRLIF